MKETKKETKKERKKQKSNPIKMKKQIKEKKH